MIPGSEPIIPNGFTGPAIVDLGYAFQLAKDIFTEYDLMDKSLRRILFASVNKQYVRSLRHYYIGYGRTTTHQLLDHLYAVYANISPADLQINNTKFCTPCDANHPIETLINQVENPFEYAAARNTPYSYEQVVSIAFQLVFQTGLFPDDCKIWKRQAPELKTRPGFKAFFATAHQEWHESLLSTAGAGFQSANHAYQQDTVDAITNLATATASDCASVAALVATNSTLFDGLGTTNAKLVTSLKEITNIIILLTDIQRTSSSRSNRSNTNRHYC